MKKLTALLLLSLTAGALCAAPVFRMDVTGLSKDGKVKLSPATGEGNTASTVVASWRAEADRPYSLTTSRGQLKGEDWSTQSATFKAEESGKVSIDLLGGWTKEVKEREWILLADVKINGEAVSNGDFSKSGKRGERVIPDGFGLGPKGEFLPEGGPDGKGAVRINHDNRLAFAFNVEAGKTYTVTVQVKPVK